MRNITATDAPNLSYAPHLLVRDFSLAPGKEWSPPSTGWTLIQIGRGAGYWLQGQSRVELGAGMVLVAGGDGRGCILASCLNGITANFFTVMTERLTGLITQGEHDFFIQSAGRRSPVGQVLPAQHPVAVKMKELCGQPNPKSLRLRLSLLQLLIEVFGRELEPTENIQLHVDVKDRLRLFLQETPPAALLEMSFDELAQLTRCTPRHLSRVFNSVAGMSFRDKRAEIRLARARELLATSQAKMVDVAFKSGYKSLSLFNQMFTRRFGISPGRWRQKNADIQDAKEQRSAKPRLAVNPGRFRKPARNEGSVPATGSGWRRIAV